MTQRRIYPLTALVISAWAALGLRLPTNIEVVMLAAAVLLLGLPHGALDVLHAQNTERLSRLRGWVAFFAMYVATALAVVGLWFVAPAASLVGLLLISALHFSTDLERGSPIALRLVHGFGPICLPAMLHAKELDKLFAALAPEETARTLASILEFMSTPLLSCSAILAVFYARRYSAAVIEVAATAAVCSVASPLLGFVVYFCLLHSWRHVDRTRRAYTPTPVTLMWSAGLPTATTAVAAVAAWNMIDPTSLESGLLQVVFIGLAALTVPHMLLIERVRLRSAKWRALVTTSTQP